MFAATQDPNIIVRLHDHAYFRIDRDWSPVVQEYRDWVAAGNVVQPMPVSEADRIASLKAEAGAVILLAYPLHEQVNMLERRVALLERGALDAAALAERAALQNAAAWIMDVRAASNAAEADGKQADDVVWPDKGATK